MTREAFIEILDKEGYSYEIEGDKIVIIDRGSVNLGFIKSIPHGVEFRNTSHVGLDSLETLHPSVRFNNGGRVILDSLKTLDSGVEFNNKKGVDLHNLKTIHPSVKFNNGGSVWLRSIIDGWYHDWDGNIDDIEPKRLLNGMIKRSIMK